MQLKDDFSVISESTKAKRLRRTTMCGWWFYFIAREMFLKSSWMTCRCCKVENRNPSWGCWWDLSKVKRIVRRHDVNSLPNFHSNTKSCLIREMCQQYHFRLPFPLPSTRTCFDRVDMNSLPLPHSGLCKNSSFFCGQRMNHGEVKPSFVSLKLLPFYIFLSAAEAGNRKNHFSGKWKLSLKMMIWNIDRGGRAAEEKHPFPVST